NIPDTRISITDNEISSSIILPTSMGISYDFDRKPLSLITQTMDRPFYVQTNILQPDISVIRVGTNDLTTNRIDRHLSEEKISKEQIDLTTENEKDEDNIEQGWYGVIHPDDETFSECYEITYQNEKQDQSSIPIKINIDPLEYKNLATSRLPQNEYEQ